MLSVALPQVRGPWRRSGPAADLRLLGQPLHLTQTAVDLLEAADLGEGLPEPLLERALKPRPPSPASPRLLLVAGLQWVSGWTGWPPWPDRGDHGLGRLAEAAGPSSRSSLEEDSRGLGRSNSSRMRRSNSVVSGGRQPGCAPPAAAAPDWRGSGVRRGRSAFQAWGSSTYPLAGRGTIDRAVQRRRRRAANPIASRAMAPGAGTG